MKCNYQMAGYTRSKNSLQRYFQFHSIGSYVVCANQNCLKEAILICTYNMLIKCKKVLIIKEIMVQFCYLIIFMHIPFGRKFKDLPANKKHLLKTKDSVKEKKNLLEIYSMFYIYILEPLQYYIIPSH